MSTPLPRPRTDAPETPAEDRLLASGLRLRQGARPSVERRRFIPYARAELVAMLERHPALAEADRGTFRSFCSVVSSVFHFALHRKVEDLKAHYAPFDPDSDTRDARALAPVERDVHEEALVSGLRDLLDDANYDELTEEQLAFALREDSLMHVSLRVDFDDFARHAVFTRGHAVKHATVPRLFFWKREIDVEVFERVAMLLKWKPKAYFDAKKRRRLPFEPGSILLKLFKDVPKADLEMLFPNAQVRMKLKDKLMIGVPGLFGGIAVLAKTGAAILAAVLVAWILLSSKVEGVPPRYPQAHEMAVIVAALLGLFGLCGYLFRQWSAYKNKTLRFAKTLAESVYFRCLDGNAGVFFRVADAAEEEECKEVILSYFFLLAARGRATAAELDRTIEQWLEDEHGATIDFEVDDALRKLEDHGLCDVDVERGEKHYRAVPLAEACRRLDAEWDGYFDFAR